MSPSVLRQSGPKWIKDGETITPKAVVHFCEGCGFEGAAFGGIGPDGKREWWCGWNGQPVCKSRGSK